MVEIGVNEETLPNHRYAISYNHAKYVPHIEYKKWRFFQVCAHHWASKTVTCTK